MQGFRVLTEAGPEAPDRVFLSKSPPGDQHSQLKELLRPAAAGTGGQKVRSNRFTRGTASTREQLARLKFEYNRDIYPSKAWMCELAEQLGLPESTIKIWFQNRRMEDMKERERMLNVIRSKETYWPLAIYTDPVLTASIPEAASARARGIAAAAADYTYPQDYYPPRSPDYYPPRYAPYPHPAFPLPDMQAPLLPPPQFNHLSPLHSYTSVSLSPDNCDASVVCRCGIINCAMGRYPPAPATVPLLPPPQFHHLRPLHSYTSVSPSPGNCDVSVCRCGIINCVMGRYPPVPHKVQVPPPPSAPSDTLNTTKQPRKLFRPFKIDLGETQMNFFNL